MNTLSNTTSRLALSVCIESIIVLLDVHSFLLDKKLKILNYLGKYCFAMALRRYSKIGTMLTDFCE